jgi:TRAP-type C4-dicarboxylate transport system permease small subunit
LIRAALARADAAIALACRWVVVGGLLGLFVLLSLGIVQRIVPLFTMTGYDELVELLFAWLTFAGSVALWREGALYRVDIADRVLGPRARQALAVLTHVAMLAIAVMLTLVGWDFVRQSGETTPFLQIDKAWWYAAIPVCGMLMAAYSVAATWRALRGEPDTVHEAATLG